MGFSSTALPQPFCCNVYRPTLYCSSIGLISPSEIIHFANLQSTFQVCLKFSWIRHKINIMIAHHNVTSLLNQLKRKWESEMLLLLAGDQLDQLWLVWLNGTASDLFNLEWVKETRLIWLTTIDCCHPQLSCEAKESQVEKMSGEYCKRDDASLGISSSTLFCFLVNQILRYHFTMLLLAWREGHSPLFILHC